MDFVKEAHEGEWFTFRCSQLIVKSISAAHTHAATITFKDKNVQMWQHDFSFRILNVFTIITLLATVTFCLRNSFTIAMLTHVKALQNILYVYCKLEHWWWHCCSHIHTWCTVAEKTVVSRQMLNASFTDTVLLYCKHMHRSLKRLSTHGEGRSKKKIF